MGLCDYEPTWRAMQRFTDTRTETTPDQIWLLEHPPVFTLGRHASAIHVLAPGDIPVVSIDRGGQVTYHGPGQLVVYPLLDIKRLGLGVRGLVRALEAALVSTLGSYGIASCPREDAPGVYVDDRKIASIGLRIKHNRCYHGLALNVAMDLDPFARINPCGYAGMELTQVSALGGPTDLDTVGIDLLDNMLTELGYNPAARSTALEASRT